MRSSIVTPTPMRPSSSMKVVTSCRCGTLAMVTGPSASSAPASIGSVAFFAPEIRISPSRGLPPWISSLSIAIASGARGPFLGREHLQCERVDLAAHAPAERAVDKPVAFERALACELACDHHRFEMDLVRARNARLRGWQLRSDECGDFFGFHGVPMALTGRR